MAKALAVVALLRLGGPRKRAAVGLVAGLLAVVAETLSGRAHLGVMADVTALVTRTTRERRHCDGDGERLNVCGVGEYRYGWN